MKMNFFSKRSTAFNIRRHKKTAICGGVFRKRVLNILGGWFEPCQREIAEVEFALMVSAMEIEIEVAREVTMKAPKRVAVGQEAGFEIGRACGQLACAYAAIEESGVVIDSLARRLGHLDDKDSHANQKWNRWALPIHLCAGQCRTD